MTKSKPLTGVQKGAILALRKVAGMEFAYIAGAVGCGVSTAGTTYNSIRKRARSDSLPDLLEAASTSVPRKKRKVKKRVEHDTNQDVPLQRWGNLQIQHRREGSGETAAEDGDSNSSVSVDPSIPEGMKVKLPGGVEVQMTEEGTTQVFNPRSATSFEAQNSLQDFEPAFIPGSLTLPSGSYFTSEIEQGLGLPSRERLQDTREVCCW